MVGRASPNDKPSTACLCDDAAAEGLNQFFTAPSLTHSLTSLQERERKIRVAGAAYEMHLVGIERAAAREGKGMKLVFLLPPSSSSSFIAPAAAPAAA